MHVAAGAGHSSSSWQSGCAFWARQLGAHEEDGREPFKIKQHEDPAGQSARSSQASDIDWDGQACAVGMHVAVPLKDTQQIPAHSASLHLTECFDASASAPASAAATPASSIGCEIEGPSAPGTFDAASPSTEDAPPSASPISRSAAPVRAAQPAAARPATVAPHTDLAPRRVFKCRGCGR